jgi:hypothetical protein
MMLQRRAHAHQTVAGTGAPNPYLSNRVAAMNASVLNARTPELRGLAQYPNMSVDNRNSFHISKVRPSSSSVIPGEDSVFRTPAPYASSYDSTPSPSSSRSSVSYGPANPGLLRRPARKSGRPVDGDYQPEEEGEADVVEHPDTPSRRPAKRGGLHMASAADDHESEDDDIVESVETAARRRAKRRKLGTSMESMTTGSTKNTRDTQTPASPTPSVASERLPLQKNRYHQSPQMEGVRKILGEKDFWEYVSLMVKFRDGEITDEQLDARARLLFQVNVLGVLPRLKRMVREMIGDGQKTGDEVKTGTSSYGAS